ncbi:MAG TPA: hypothetical protein VGF45_15115 [Polyangia bacterium]
MFPRSKPARWFAPGVLALFIVAGCRDDRQPPGPGTVDAGGDDAVADATPASGGRSGAGGVTGSGGAAGRPGGQGGRVGSGGAAGQAAGGASGQGGVTGSGGTTIDAGGSGGMRADASPPDRPADAPRDVTTPDLPPRDTVGCPPVCAIFCPYGNVLDERGCPTCTCNPRECKPSECSPAAPKPLPIMCPDGTTTGQACERDSKGQCRWVTTTCQPSAGCAAATTRAACQAKLSCRWLTPGCTQPKLAAPGCHERTAIGCVPGGCPAGKTCTTQVIDPCGERVSPGAPAPSVDPMLIPPPNCDACGQQITICL